MVKDTTYMQWMRQEQLPVVRGYGVIDLHTLKLGAWKRLGGRGAFIQLEGQEGLTGMYVGEIPPGAELKPEKHLYDELICILSGLGAAEIWSPTGEGPHTVVEWQTGSLFAPPLNSWHRLANLSGTEPVRFLAVTTAPIAMDLYHNIDFIFTNPYAFQDRYDGRSDYFNMGPRVPGARAWETNFVPDVRSVRLDVSETKGQGGRTTLYEMAGNVLVGQLSEWPVGRYRKAHYHGGGANLLTLGSHGYALMWPRELGIHPYEDGHGDRIVAMEWRDGSVLSPPTGWFHQFFNTGSTPARNIALRYGSQKYGVQFHDIHSQAGVTVSILAGGTMIEFEEEDVEIRERYQRELTANGVEYLMRDSFTETRR